MRTTFRWTLLRLLALMTVTSTVASAGTTGKIAGQIRDAGSGDSLLGANVRVHDMNLGGVADVDGRYVIINVPPGTYTLEFSYIGYHPHIVQGVQVSVDRTSNLDIRMTSQSIEVEGVTVTATRPVVEMDRTHTSSVVNATTVESMPVTEVSEVIALQSGVVQADGALHIRGGRSREVSYVIDGVPVSNAFSQGGGNNVTIENSMIEELEVISGTFNAEYGSAQSGIINIVTKRPSSKLSGRLQTYTGEWFSGHDDVYLDVDDFDPAAERDVQLSLSGPILKDRLGFFVSTRYNRHESLDRYERRFNTTDGARIAAYREWVQTYQPAQSTQSQAITIPDSLATGDGSTGPLSTGYDLSFQGKLNWFPTQSVTVGYQLFASVSETDGSSSRTYRYAPDEIGTSRSVAWSHFLSWHHALSHKLFYNVNVALQHNDGESWYDKDNPVALVPGEDGIQLLSAAADGFSLGGTGGFYTGRDGKGYRDVLTLKGDINWQADRWNLVKAGFLLSMHDINVYSRGYRQSTAWANNQFPVERLQIADGDANRDPTYAEYWDFLANDYWPNWEALYGTTPYVAIADSEVTQFRDYDIDPTEVAFYLQDKVELGELILNAGVRLDGFQPNEQFTSNPRTEASRLGSEANLEDAEMRWQLSPRLGVSFPVSDRGVFHASYGHFFQMPSFEKMFNEPILTLTRLQLEGRRLGNATLEPEKTVQYEIGMQQGLTETIALDVTAYYKDFRNLLGIEQLTTIDAVTYTRFVNRDYGSTKGLTLSLSTAGYGLLSGGLNYTLAFANGSSSDPEELELIQTASRIGADAEVFVDRKVLPLDWDQRHSLNAYVNLDKRRDWSVGLVGTYNSGVPFSPVFVERFDIAEREFVNRATRPSRWTLDLKARKYFRLGGLDSAVIVKVDNLFDHLNHEQVHATTGTADQIARLPEIEELDKQRLAEEGLFTLEEIDVSPGYFSSPRRIQIGYEVNF